MIAKYKIDIILCLLAIVPSTISLIIDLTCINDYYWLQRSGSLMVLFSVILDLRQNNFTEQKESKDVFSNNKPIIIGKSLPDTRQKLKYFAVALIVVGTFIWGYGDVPFKIT